ncbi:MAG TPA: hypothetical protein VIN75_07255, partial [Burkholderiaceae bacterium]
MNLHASQSEIDVLEGVLRRSPPGEGVVATKVALAWHLRQRDSGRTLQLVQDVMPIVRASRASTHGDAIASCHARAALAAAEASALYGETVEAERCLGDARAHLDPAWDPQADGDAWLVESLIARLRGDQDRVARGIGLAALAARGPGLAGGRLGAGRGAFERDPGLGHLQPLAILQPREAAARLAQRGLQSLGLSAQAGDQRLDQPGVALRLRIPRGIEMGARVAQTALGLHRLAVQRRGFGRRERGARVAAGDGVAVRARARGAHDRHDVLHQLQRAAAVAL